MGRKAPPRPMPSWSMLRRCAAHPPVLLIVDTHCGAYVPLPERWLRSLLLCDTCKLLMQNLVPRGQPSARLGHGCSHGAVSCPSDHGCMCMEIL